MDMGRLDKGYPRNIVAYVSPRNPYRPLADG